VTFAKLRLILKNLEILEAGALVVRVLGMAASKEAIRTLLSINYISSSA